MGMKGGLFNPFFTGDYSWWGGTGSSLPSVPSSPGYAALGNVEAIYDSTGLVSNTNNSYGQVDSSNNISTAGWKSLAPGPTGRDMLVVNVRGTGNMCIQTVGTVPVIDCNGFANLKNTGGSANFNFLHYNATFANLKWTVHMLVRPGFGSDPAEAYGFLGNNAGSPNNKGLYIFNDDRTNVPAVNRLAHGIAKGSAGLISTSADNSILTPNTWVLLTIEFDGSLAAGSRFRALVNNVAATLVVTSASTAVVTTPSFDLELFAIGNAVVPMTGQMSHCIIQSRVETTGVRDAFVATMMLWRTYLDAHQANEVNDRMHIYNTFNEDGTRYYLSSYLRKNPVNGAIMQLFSESDGHLADNARKIGFRKSTDDGLTFGAKGTAVDPASTVCTSDFCAGYDSTGRLWVPTDQHTVSGSNFGAPHYLKVMYTDNDFATAGTEVDLTSLVPSDSLSTWRCHGKVIENNGFIMFNIYKVTDEGTTTNSANYLFKIALGANPATLGNWSVKTIRASAAAYINETDIEALSSTVLIAISRSDTTNEWNLFKSVDNGENWTDSGALTFGEALSLAGPARIAGFTHNGVACKVCYYPDRSGRLLKAIYGTVADLISNPITGWKTASKVTIVPDLLHYGGVLHKDNDFYGIGSYCREPNPQTLTESKVVLFYTPTNHEATMETALAI